MPFALPIAIFLAGVAAFSEIVGVGMWSGLSILCAVGVGSFASAFVVAAVREHRNPTFSTAEWMARNPAAGSKATQYGKRPHGWIGFKKNGMLFEFQALRMGAGYRVYILSHPAYGELATDNHSAHCYYDPIRQLHYVCTITAPKTFEQAKEDARAWAYYTEHYIRTGQILTV